MLSSSHVQNSQENLQKYPSENKCPPRMALPIKASRYLLKDYFCNLQNVFFHIEDFKNKDNLIFQGRVVVYVDIEFINPEGTAFVAKELWIRAGVGGSIQNKGNLEGIEHLHLDSGQISNQGFLKGNSARIQFDTLNNESGKILIPGQTEIEAYGSVQNAQGVIDVKGPLYLKGGFWDNTNGKILGELGIAASIEGLDNLENGIIKSSAGLVEVFTFQDLHHRGSIEGYAGIHLLSKTGAIKCCHGQLIAPGKDILIQSQRLLENILASDEGAGAELLDLSISLENVHIVDAGLIIVQSNSGVLIEDSMFESLENISFYSVQLAMKKILGKALQGKINIKAEIGKFTDVEFISSDTQKVIVDTADFFGVQHTSKEGSLKFKTKEWGDFEDCTMVSEKESVKYISEVALTFKKTVTQALKRIHQQSADIVDELSTYKAETITQRGLAIDGRIQTFITDTLLAEFDEQANYLEGNIQAGKEFSLLSSGSYVNLSKTQMDVGDFTIKAHEQIGLQEAIIELKGGTALCESQTKGIEAQKSRITSFSEREGEIVFQAPEGIVHLNDNITDVHHKVNILSRYVITKDSFLKSPKGIFFKGDRLHGSDSQLISDQGNLSFELAKSISLDNILKRAIQGEIQQKSGEWISEKQNENEGREIVRLSSNIFVKETKDTAKEIKNQSAEGLYLSSYNAEAGEKIQLASEENSTIKNSRLTSPHIEMKASSQRLKKDEIYFDEMEVHSQTLQVQKSHLVGGESKVSVSEDAQILDNAIDIVKNRIQAGNTILFQENKIEGALVLESKSDQSLLSNTLSSGNLTVESNTGNVSLHNNTINRLQTVEITASQGKASLSHNQVELKDLSVEADTISMIKENVDAEENITLKAESEMAIEIVKMKANNGGIVVESLQTTISDGQFESDKELVLKAARGNLQNVELTSLEEVKIGLDNGSFEKGKIFGNEGIQLNSRESFRGEALEMASERDFTFSGDMAYFKDISIEANNALQEASNLQNINLNINAKQSIIRKAKIIQNEQGVDQASQIFETSEKASHYQHAMRAQEKIDQKSDELKIHKSSLESPHIQWASDQIDGTGNKVHAWKFEISSDHIDLPLNHFATKTLNVKGKGQASFPQSEIEGKVVIDPYFSEVDLTQATIEGSLQISRNEMSSQNQALSPIVQHDPVEKRRFPSTFEGVSTESLKQVLRKRGILTGSHDLLIEDGNGTIDKERIEHKMRGATPFEEEILLRHFNNSQEAFGIRHVNESHWTYLKKISEGQYQEISTLGDGNCLFNGIAMGLCDLARSERIDFPPHVLIRLQEKLGLNSPDMESFKAWVEDQSLDRQQTDLQGVLRNIAVDFIEEHYEEVYQDSYCNQLYNAYFQPLEDDTFKTHLHIAEIFKNRDMDFESLSEWWETIGKAAYFINIRQSAWGGEVELDSLARIFGITLFWKKGEGSRKIGGTIIQEFDEEQIKRLLALDIGERVGRGFQMQRYDVVEELIDKIKPMHPSYVEIVERVIEELEREIIESQEVVPIVYFPETGLPKVDASSLKINGQSLEIDASALWAPDLKAHVNEGVALQIEEVANICHADIQSADGGISVKAKALTAREMKALVKGNVDIKADRSADLEHADVQMHGKAEFTSSFLNLSHSKIIAQSIIENGALGIAAKKSAQTAATTLEQISKGMIDDSSSTMQAGLITLQSEAMIDHTESISRCFQCKIKAPIFENPRGEIDGNVNIESNFFNNADALLKLGTGISHIESNTVNTNAGSNITGPGGIMIKSQEAYHEKSHVDIEGPYQVQAKEIEIDTDLTAQKVYLRSIEGKVKIDERRTITIADEGGIEGEQLDNLGKIKSAKKLAIHQKHYQDPGDVEALQRLELSSESAIELKKPMTIPGGLTIISDKSVKTQAPLDINGDFAVGAMDIELCERVHAEGAGIFQSKQGLKFLKMQAVFKKGIQAKIEGILSILTSDIYIESNTEKPSFIDCESFQIKGVVIPPRRRWFQGTTAYSYPHKSSNFRHVGDLTLHVINEAFNLASNFFVEDGNFNLSGGEWKNKNIEHTYYWAEEAGTASRRKWYGKKKKETLYIYHQRSVIDGAANTQIGGVFSIDLAKTILNDGVILALVIRILRLDKLFNGIFSGNSETPLTLPQNLPYLPEMPTALPGGYFGSPNSIHARILSLFYNRGYVRSRIVSIQAPEIIIEKRVVKLLADVAKYGRFGKLSKVQVVIQQAQPGGEVSGDQVHLFPEEKGFNRGGEVSGDLVHIEGKNFFLEPVEETSVVHLKPKVAPWKKCIAGSIRTDFIGARCIGNRVKIHLVRTLSNTASDILGFKTDISAGRIFQHTLFSYFVSTIKKGWTVNKKLHTIVMSEGRIRSIQALNMEATESDMNIEGEVGSLQGHLKMVAARHINFIACALIVHNKVSKPSAYFIGVDFKRTKFTISRSSVPHVYAGAGFELRAGENFNATGLQLDVIGLGKIKAKRVFNRDHQVKHSQTVRGLSIGVSFLGVPAVRALIEGRKRKEIFQALISQDAAMSSLWKLKSSKDGVEFVTNTVVSIINIWNAFKNFNSWGEHLGLFDSKGKFRPVVTLEAGVSKHTRKWTETIPSLWNLDDIVVKAPLQIYEGGIYKINNNARYKFIDITFRSSKDTYSERGTKGSVSLSFGPEGIGVGADIGLSKGSGTIHRPLRMHVGGNLQIDGGRSMSVAGAQISANTVTGIVNSLYLETPQDSHSQRNLSLGGSTSGRISFAMGNFKETFASSITIIEARSSGKFKARQVRLKGAATNNIKLKTKDFKHAPISNIRHGWNLGVNLAIPQKNQGIRYLGDIDFRSERQKGVMHATVAGANGSALGGVNTNLNAMEEIGKRKKHHFGAPLIDFNLDMLKSEGKQIADKLFSAPQKAPLRPIPAPQRTEEPPVPEEFVEEELVVEKTKKKPPTKKEVPTLKQPAPALINTSLDGYVMEGEIDIKFKEKFVLDLFNAMIFDASKAKARKIEREIKKITELKAKDPYWIQRKTSMEGHIYTARTFGFVLDAVGFLIEKAVKYKIEDIETKAFLMKKGITLIADLTNNRPAYEKLSQLFKAYAQEKKAAANLWTEQQLLKPLQESRIYNFFENSNYHLVQHFESEFLIPEKVTRQYISDSNNILLTCIPLPPVAKITKLAVKPIQAINKGVRQAVNGTGRVYKAASQAIKEAKQAKTIALKSRNVTITPRSESISAAATYKVPASRKVETPCVQPPAMQTFMNNMNGIAKSYPGKTMAYAIDKNCDEIVKNLPVYTHLGKSTEQLAISIAQSGRPASLVAPKMHYFKVDECRVARIDMQPKKVIFKASEDDPFKILREIAGTDLAGSLPLKHLQIPKLIAAGVNNESIFVLKTYIEGESIESLLKTLGSVPAQSPERQILFDEIIKACHQAGKGVGEFQSIGLIHKVEYTPHVEWYKGALEGNCADANSLLRKENLSLINEGSSYFKTLESNFQNNPGHISWGFHDIGVEELIYSKTHKHVGFVDNEFVTSCYDVFKKPVALTVREYFEFIKSFLIDGLRNGLSLQEIRFFQDAFREGYFSEFGGIQSLAAVEYFQLQSSIEAVSLLAGTVDRRVIAPLVEQINYQTTRTGVGSEAGTKVSSFTSIPSSPQSNIHEVTDSIYNILAGKEAVSMRRAINSSYNEIHQIIPQFTHSGLEKEAIWLSSLPKSNTATNPLIHYFVQPNEVTETNRYVAKITAKTAIVVKDSPDIVSLVGELIGNNYMNSLPSKYFEIPKMIGIGRYMVGREERYFVTKTHISGESLENLMFITGSHETGTPWRNLSFDQLKVVSNRLGKGVGEFQSMGLVHEVKPSLENLDKTVEWVEETIETVNDLLWSLDMPVRIEGCHNYFKSLAMGFKKEGTNLTTGNGFMDISAGQFIVADKGKIGFIDAEFIPAYLNTDKKPLAIPTKEYFDFMTMFDTEGIASSLTFAEINELKEAFRAGYLNEYKGISIREVEQFFELDSSVSTIFYLAGRIKAGANIDPKILTQLIENLNQKAAAGKAVQPLTSTANEISSPQNIVKIPKVEVSHQLSKSSSSRVISENRLTSGSSIFISPRKKVQTVKIPGKAPTSAKEMIKLFTDIGYKIKKGNAGSHLKLIRESSPSIVIPWHKELPKGTANSLFKKYKKIVKADDANLSLVHGTQFNSSVISTVVALSAQTGFGFDKSSLIITGIAASVLGLKLLKPRLNLFWSASQKMPTAFKSMQKVKREINPTNYVPNFTLVNSPEPTLSFKHIYKVDEDKFISLRHRLFVYDGPMVMYRTAKISSDTLYAYVQFVGHQSVILRANKTTRWQDGLELVEVLKTNSTTGLAYKTLMEIQEIARKEGTKRILLGFVAENKKILSKLNNHFTYLGREYRDSVPVDQFEIILKD